MKPLKRLRKEAEELINFGNSKEIARGFGILDTLNAVKQLKKQKKEQRTKQVLDNI